MTAPRIGVIGAGNWGRNHVRTLAASRKASLAAVVEIDAGKRESFALQYPGVAVTDSLESVLDSIDGAVIATPGRHHTELGIRLLEAGKPVLIEKPLALSADDAASIVSVSERTGVAALVGHLLVFHPAVERLRQLIESGDLGDIYYLYSQRVNLGQIRPDENALWSFGPHDVSVALELLRETPGGVSARGKSFLQDGIEDVVFLMMEFPSGAIMNVQLSWLDPHKERRLTVVGSRKMAVFDDMEAREKLKIYDKGVSKPPEYGSYGESLSIREGDIHIPRVRNAEPLAAELNHFAHVISGSERNERISAASGEQVIRILEAASRSLQNNGERISID